MMEKIWKNLHSAYQNEPLFLYFQHDIPKTLTSNNDRRNDLIQAYEIPKTLLLVKQNPLNFYFRELIFLFNV